MFLNDKVGLNKVLVLESIFFATCFLMEVPSGILSDRWGRERILKMATIAMFLGYCGFAFGQGFYFFVVGEILLGIAFSFRSGSESSLLFELWEKDTTRQRGDFLQERERLEFRSNLIVGVSAIIGGVSYYFAPALPFLLSLSSCALAAIYLFKVGNCPPAETINPAQSSWSSLLKKSRESSFVLWASLYFLLIALFDHIPYQYFQIVLKNFSPEGYPLSIVSGIQVGSTMFVGSLGVKLLSQYRQSIFTQGNFLMILLIVILAVMGFSTHYWCLLLIACRQIPLSVFRYRYEGAVIPLVDQKLRATFLSCQTLVTKAVISLTLLGLTLIPGEKKQLFYSALSGGFILLSVHFLRKKYQIKEKR